jgi:nitrogen fixation protein NifB
MTVIPLSSAPKFTIQASDGSNVLHLPVASQAVCGLRFTSATKAVQALTATEALMEVDRHKERVGVELMGPGDPLASMGTTLEIIKILKKRHPALSISLTTLGLGGAEHAADLAAAGLDKINLLVDTLDSATAEKIYAWVRPGKKTMPLAKTVAMVLADQPKTVQGMAEARIKVSIRTTIYPGINAHQVVNIAEAMAELGAQEMELLPYSPDPQQADLPPPTTRVHMEQIGKLTSRYLITRIRQVAVDACGCSTSGCGCGCGCGSATGPTIQPVVPKPSVERPRVAVASVTGMDVDLHLGQAKKLLIYGPRGDGLTCLLETRQAPEPGSGETRWDQLADILPDCFALLASSAGQRPREVLAGRGIRVILTEENIEGSVDVLYGGGKKGKCKK